MAGYKGFEYISPDEVAQAEQQGFERIVASGNPGALRLAIAQRAASGIAPNPVMRKAKQTEAILKDAFKSAPQTGDEVEDQIGFLQKAQQAAVEAGIPEVALQATAQLSALRVTQEERNRLKADEARTQREFDTESLISEQMVLVDKDGNAVRNIDLKNEEHRVELLETLSEDPSLRLITQDELWGFTSDQLLLREQLKAAQATAQAKATGKGPDTVTLRRYALHGNNQLGLMQATDQMTLLMTENPGIFTSAADIEAGVSNLATQGRALIASAFDGGSSAFEIKINNRLDKFGIVNAQKRALIMNMAYALATAREGGRLTDQDIDRAIVSLGFLDNPNPLAVASVIRQNLEGGLKDWENRSRVARVGEYDPATYEVVRDQYRNSIRLVDNMITKFGGVGPIKIDISPPGQRSTATPVQGSKESITVTLIPEEEKKEEED